MKLAIFGATGSVGRHIVEQALDQGHQVTAVARSPQALSLLHPNLKMFAVDVFDPEAVALAIKGAEAVLVTLGSPKMSGTVRSTGTRHIVAAMQKQGVKRLVCQTTLGAGDSRGNLDFIWKYIMFGVLLRKVLKDHEVQEGIVRTSNLDWSIVRPAAFTDGPMTNNFKSGFPAGDRDLTLKISRADVAQFMLQQLDSDEWLHKAPGLSY
ncbi:SDR family oxidoreductase [Emcibacter sp.]|uniref:NAD(P)-dependent oxidoreductase n=1 Tax=Emcibacter sp. TaxID=1979954 RepID=UPI002AA5F044|nr:SDR family oxidoreductase [Emcibacter sp.]